MEKSKTLQNFIPKIVILEVLIFFFILLLIGIFFNKEDPLFLNSLFSPLILLSLSFTLYYGFLSGIILIFLAFLYSVFFYSKIPTTSILWNTIIVLIAGEFKYYWERRIRDAERESIYLYEKLETLKRNYYLLKLSHDQLENNYILRPFSIRNLLKEIKKELLTKKDEKLMAEFFLNLISQNFMISSASLYKTKNQKHFELLAKIGKTPELNLKDPVVKTVLFSETSHYILPEDIKALIQKGTPPKYLAGIIAKKEKTIWLLTINEISFTYLNEETLNYIYILLLYLIEDVEFSYEIVTKAQCDLDFLKDFQKAYRYYKEFKTESSLVIFSVKKDIDKFINSIEAHIKSLDSVCQYDKDKVLVLLPFTKTSGAEIFSKRIKNLFPEVEVLKILRVDKTLEDLIKEI